MQTKRDPVPLSTPTSTPKKKAVGTPARAVSPTVSAAVLRRRKVDAARWKTDFVLSNSRSPLSNFDLRALLCQPEAWTALSADEQKEVLALFPPETKSIVVDAATGEARPDIPSLKNDDNFRHDCARFRSDLQGGFFDRHWLESAFEAHMMRREGFFDAYVVKEFESSWGVQVPDKYKPVAMRTDAKAEQKKEEENANREPNGGAKQRR